MSTGYLAPISFGESSFGESSYGESSFGESSFGEISFGESRQTIWVEEGSRMKRSSWIRVLLVLFIAILVLLWALSQKVGPQNAESLSETRIYAYRDWQSVGILVQPGDRVDMRAGGRWLYTPGEYHGPEGHRYYLAPDTYPINAAAGGVLLGRIGENSPIFLIGRGRTVMVDQPGLLYFRINDDILGDNEGYITLELLVTKADTND